MTRIYAGIDSPIMATDITGAEMVKSGSDAYLATKSSSIDEIVALYDSLGASIDDVSECPAMDSATGGRIQAGVEYGVPVFRKMSKRSSNWTGVTSPTLICRGR